MSTMMNRFFSAVAFLTILMGSAQAQSTCNGLTVYTGTFGTLTDGSFDGDYSNDADCQLLIEPAGVMQIRLQFDSVFTELNTDTVVVYDGNSTSAPVLAKYSGSNPLGSLPVLLSSGGSLLITFHSNSSVTGTGWQASYLTSYCKDADTLTTFNGSFGDGSTMGAYLGLSQCSWLLQPVGALAVELNVTYYSLEDADNCYDYIRVFDGADATAPVIGTYCNANPPPSSIVSSGPSLYVEFRSDFNVEYDGFNADYYGIAEYCGPLKTYTAASGTVNDGSGSRNYLNNSDCTFLIAPPASAKLKLVFTDFDTELGYDTVFVYDGPDATYPLLGKYTGNTLPPTLLTSGGKAFIHFMSDVGVTAPGWSLNYTSPVFYDQTYCGASQSVFNTLNGSIEDGSGNFNYKNYSNCSYLIKPTASNVSFLNIDFSSFETEKGKDVVMIYDGNNDRAPLIASFSGSSIPPSVKTTGPEALVKFISDAGNTFDGWVLNYQSDTLGTTFCNTRTELTAASGSFEDGSGATGNYANRSACKWVISPKDALTVTLNFPKVKTQKNKDYIAVYDGPDNTAPLLSTLSGDTTAMSITSTGATVMVQFVSDDVTTDSGWVANYTSTKALANDYCSGITTLTQKDGSVSDGSGPKNYANGSDCKWLIKPVGAKTITLTFTSFATEADHDYVYIYDGETEADKLLGTFSGSSIPGDIHTSKGKALIKFSSDAASVAAGWDINYTSEISSAASYCVGTTNLTTRTGSFSDGSGPEEYQPDANCKWLIKPSNVSRIQLYFDEFDTEGGFDFVKVYKGNTEDKTKLLGSFSGNNLPSMVETNDPMMLVVFSSDESGNRTGWAAHYTSDSLGGPTYCVPAVNSGTSRGDYIDGVRLRGINNMFTGSASGPFYNDYTSMSTDLSSGARYTIRVIAGQRSGDRFVGWIDYNDNKQFESSEKIFSATNKEAAEILSIPFYVSDNLADTGLKRLRVLCSSADITGACDPVTYGEVEDYTVVIMKCALGKLTMQPILGEQELCSGVESDYSTKMVDGVINYSWSIGPASWKITKQVSNPKENIKITAKAGFDAGTICVEGSNKCLKSTAECIDVNIRPLPDPVNDLTAQDSACSSETVTFEVIDGQTRDEYKYNWTFPSGTAIIGEQHAGIVKAKMGLASGDVSVVAVNDCGVSSPVKKNIAVIVKPNAPQWDKKEARPCTRDSAIYSVKFSKDITYYNWSVPGDWLILSGQGKRQIVAFTGDKGGTISVEVSNRCFSSSPLKSEVTVSPCVSGIDENTAMAVQVYPNPNNGSFTIEFDPQATPKALRVLNVLGQEVWKEERSQYTGKSMVAVDLLGQPNGLYLVEVQSEEGSSFQRLVLGAE